MITSGTARILISLLTVRLLSFLTVCVPGVAAVHDEVPAASERQKIEYLIRSVEELGNAKFIRNGRTYDANRAADHLRLKLRKAESRCNTAEDFITVCGSRSSISGLPYRIRFADGSVLSSEAFLRAKLKELNTPSK